jgi:hypothetical protein
MRVTSRVASSLVVFGLLASVAAAQPNVSRLKGRIVTEQGEPVKDAEVRAEAFFGAQAGPFAGQRTFSTRTDAKGEWSILGITPGIWLFEAVAPGYVPEAVALPNRLVTATSPGGGGLMFTWDLILKPMPVPSGDLGAILTSAIDAAHANKADEVRATLQRVLPTEADAEFLAAAGRVAVAVREMGLANALFRSAAERDPASYRAALGMASMFLLQRNFDSASRAFDGARGRTHDKNEQRFLSAAIGDLATIKVR